MKTHTTSGIQVTEYDEPDTEDEPMDTMDEGALSETEAMRLLDDKEREFPPLQKGYKKKAPPTDEITVKIAKHKKKRKEDE
jgi:hypothetical protein